MTDMSDIERFAERIRQARKIGGEDRIFVFDDIIADLRNDLNDIQTMIEECERAKTEEKEEEESMIDFDLLQNWGMPDDVLPETWAKARACSNETLHDWIKFYEAYYAENGENGPAEFRAEVALLVLRERGEEVVIHAGW